MQIQNKPFLWHMLLVSILLCGFCKVQNRAAIFWWWDTIVAAHLLAQLPGF